MLPLPEIHFSTSNLTLMKVKEVISASVLLAVAMGFKARRIVLPTLCAKMQATCAKKEALVIKKKTLMNNALTKQRKKHAFEGLERALEAKVLRLNTKAAETNTHKTLGYNSGSTTYRFLLGTVLLAALMACPCYAEESPVNELLDHVLDQGNKLLDPSSLLPISIAAVANEDLETSLSTVRDSSDGPRAAQQQHEEQLQAQVAQQDIAMDTPKAEDTFTFLNDVPSWHQFCVKVEISPTFSLSISSFDIRHGSCIVL